MTKLQIRVAGPHLEEGEEACATGNAAASEANRSGSRVNPFDMRTENFYQFGSPWNRITRIKKVILCPPKIICQAIDPGDAGNQPRDLH
jgi:hypothetical protein